MDAHPIDQTQPDARRLNAPVGLGPTLRRPAVWIGVTVGVLNLLDLSAFEPASFLTWLLPVLALCYLIFGLVRQHHPLRSVALRQGLGLLLFTGFALAALVLDAQIGQYVIAAGYLAHAAWDYAHRDGRTVPRWFVDVCVPLDVLIAAALVAAALVH